MVQLTPSASGAGEATASPAPAVELRGITKRFGEVVACDRVDLCVQPGEIHGLLGQNGAGKSTLMKVLLGLLTPDGGTIHIGGRPVVVSDPLAAAELGIAMVHQHFSVIGALTVWENVTLGEKSRLDERRSVRHVAEISERYGLDVDPLARVDTLTPGQRQRVEIVKCLRRDPSIVILDEPTSVLTLSESEELFSTLRHVVRDEGRAVVLISHKLDEVLHATDRVTIMRTGAVVGREDTCDTDARSLARAMVGREVSLRTEAAALGLVHEAEEAAVSDADPGAGVVATATTRPVVLRVADAAVRTRDGRRPLDGLSLEVHEGEILGLAGVEGNGQAALADLLSSLVGLERGAVEVGGEPVRPGRPGAMARAGIGVIPEDRHESGCVLGMSVAENLVLDDVCRVGARRQIISPHAIRRHAEALIEQYEITTPSPDTPMSSLSGGNQQKVVLARELSRGPRVLVAAQPTHGLDVGAVEYLTDQLRAAAQRGVGVLLISTELEEILSLADRVAVIHSGRIMGCLPRSEADLELIGMMLGGREL
jgi:general nucleoside transport system ATP-binding protein